ncbi:hypothetical protein MMC18_000737 [Xylographa bjoerkii]|nr:hypothetical protein [Xylographa bjoerkii]
MSLFYVGRVISGLGVGAATVLVPIYAAEMSPKEIRGRLGSCFQLFFAGGVCVSYWVDYAVEARVAPSTRQWQIPIALQMVPGGLVGLGMLLIKESARWLAKRGRNEEALESLIWVRGEDTPEVQAEFAEILMGIQEEIRATEGVTWREVNLPANRYRLFIAVTLQLCQQPLARLQIHSYTEELTQTSSARLTGNTSLAYYAPQIFAAVGAGTSNLLITGFFGIIKVISVLCFQVIGTVSGNLPENVNQPVQAFLVERIGRKWAFMGGAAGMGTCMLIIAIIVAIFPPNPLATTITSSGAAAIAIVYLEAASYNLSWGPCAWLYLGEMFPSRIREIGVASGAASQWVFNFMMSQITPHAIANIGAWKTFMMFCIFNYAIVVYAWWFLRETKGRSLEEMETVFGSAETAFDVEATRRKAILGATADAKQSATARVDRIGEGS